MQEFYFAQKAFIVKERCLLLVRKSEDDPNQAGKWEVPGGRMSFGEEIDDHLKREVWEEAGIEVSPDRPFHIWQWRLVRPGESGEVRNIQIVAVARLCNPLTTQISAANRIKDDFLAEMRWVPISELKQINFISNMYPVIDAFLACPEIKCLQGM